MQTVARRSAAMLEGSHRRTVSGLGSESHVDTRFEPLSVTYWRRPGMYTRRICSQPSIFR